MKRGKRQVIDREPQPIQAQSQQFQMQINKSNLPQTYYSKPEKNQETNHFNHLNIDSRTMQQAQISLGQAKSNSDDAEEKRKKIELLKQKYLKKSKPQDTKPQSQIYQETQPLPNNNIQKIQSKIISLPQNTQSKKLQNETKNYTIEPPKTQNLNQYYTNRQLTEKHIKKPVIENEKKEIEQENFVKDKQQDSSGVYESKKAQVPRIHEVPKPPVKIQGRNAPPPPPIKKTTPLAVVPTDQTSGLNKQTITPSVDELSKKTVPLPVKQQLIKQKTEPGDKTQRSDNLSFAPPSLQGNQVNRTDQKDNQNVPPPSINPNMRQILNKKFSQKHVPKPPVRPPPPKIDQFDHQQNESNPNFQLNTLGNQTGRKELPIKQVNAQIDDEYNGVESGQNSHVVHKTKPYEEVDASRFVGEWLGSPELTLKELFPHLKETIEFYCLNKNLTIKITSNNPGFTPLIAELVQSFILNNTTKYSADQKRVTESICLNFFYSSPTQFSDIFLVLLIKTGEEYLQKYQKALQDKLENYLSRIIFYKNLFLPQEITSFVAFCIEKSLVRQGNFLQFLMLTENAQLVNFINNTQIQQLNHKLGLLSFCKLNLKNKNLIPLYLKLISSIQVELGRNGLVQKVLNHMKELDIPQNLYQYTKQLKLKLLKNYENNSQPESNNFSKVENNNQPASNETSKDSGLFGYFNLNKAIDKIKTSTEKALSGAIGEPKKAPEQQKKDQIVYDPIRKRYIINGEIPEDENEVEATTITEVKPKVPPPPPLGGARKAPPPMHNKKPGPRIAGNRYA